MVVFDTTTAFVEGVKMTTAKTIKKFRKEKGLTQKQLGELCVPRIAESTIRKYELGILNPKIETIEKIATALEIDPFSLYSFDMATGLLEKSMNDKIQIDDKADTLLRNYQQLNDSGQDKAIEQVEMLTKIPEYRKDTDTGE